MKGGIDFWPISEDQVFGDGLSELLCDIADQTLAADERQRCAGQSEQLQQGSSRVVHTSITGVFDSPGVLAFELEREGALSLAIALRLIAPEPIMIEAGRTTNQPSIGSR